MSDSLTESAHNFLAEQLKNSVVQNIAAKTLNIKTLTPQNRDSLDFHDLHVILIKKALEQAYDAGASK